MIAQEIKKYTKGAANLSFKHQIVLKVVEEFIFSRLKRDLEACYGEHLPKSEAFRQKIREIQRLPLKDVLDFLEIKNVFRLHKEDPNTFGYHLAVNELNKLKYTGSPSEKLAT